MINHGRTLLLNVAGEASFADYPGEEILPADYRPVVLTSPLAAVRRVLFGSDPDRYMLNYRGRQLLQLIHATELAEFLSDLDPRLTYEFDESPFDDGQFRPVISRFAGSDAAQLFVSGTPPAPDASGRMLRVWEVTVTSGVFAEVRLQWPLRQTTNAFTVADNLSSRVPLVLSDMGVTFRPEVGAKWRLSVLSRPAVELGALLASLDTIGEPVLAELFGRATPAGSAEPLLTFYNLWRDHKELAYRLGGLVLALIYQTEALR